MRKWLVLAVLFLAMPLSPAATLCIHRGVDNARTTLEQEFHESRWVVRARVISADTHWSDEDESWTLYGLEVVHSYKGSLLRRFTFFTGRNSGGFYMDGDNGRPDLGGEYLLFLVPHPRSSTNPPAARRALWVNYNCGQSKRWTEVTAGEASRLRALSGRR